MAVSLNFRTALSGFHKEDVVHYIEYMNSKHTAQVNQLTNENEELHRKLQQLPEVPDLREEMDALTAQLEELRQRCEALEQENAQLRADAQSDEATEADGEPQEDPRELMSMELEAYRRAEQAERSAKLRAEQIYQQATGTLAQATAQVDEAADRYRRIADQVNVRIAELQAAVESSKSALQDAVATMSAIRPEDAED